MKARPISYKKQMIVAKKNGWKTVTRRPIKIDTSKRFEFWDIDEKGRAVFEDLERDNTTAWLENIKCPYGTPGDQLYTKENYQIIKRSKVDQSVLVNYKADDSTKWMMLPDGDWERYLDWKEPFGSKASLFMYKSLSRFWDEITWIRVEQIQSILPSEVWQEGIRIPLPETRSRKFLSTAAHPWKYLKKFESLWQSMYESGPYDWNKNPWVWVVRYKPIIVNGMITNQKELEI